MTIDLSVQEIESMLRERELVMRLDYMSDDHEWIVWLHAPDDPKLGAFVGADEYLSQAIRKAFDAWDQSPHEEE